MDEKINKLESHNSQELKNEALKQVEFKKGFEDAYLDEIKTSLDDRLAIDLMDEHGEDYYYNDENYEKGSISYEEGKHIGSQIIQQRQYAQELARGKNLAKDSDFKIGFSHGYNTQQKFPELAIKEQNYYDNSITQNDYQHGYIEGSEYYLRQTEDNARDPYSKPLELHDYNKQYFQGHINAVIDYGSNKIGVNNDVIIYEKNVAPSSYEKGYIDGYHFSKEEKDLYDKNEFNSGFVNGYDEELKGNRHDFDYWEVETDAFKEGLYAGRHFRSEKHWHIERIQFNAIEVEENTRSQKGLSSEISTLEQMLIEDKSEFKEGFSHGYNMRQNIPTLAKLETEYYIKNTKSIYEKGYVSGSQYVSNRTANINEALNKQTYHGITYKDMSKTSEIPKEALHDRDTLMSEMTLPKYQEQYSQGVNDAQEHYKNDPQNACENTLFYRREEFFPDDPHPTYVEPSSPYQLGYVEGIDKLVKRDKQNLVDRNKKTQIFEKAKIKIDKFKQALEKYSPIQRSSDNQFKEKDQDKGMDI